MSHSNDDHAAREAARELIEDLGQLADRMTAEGTNTIAAGTPGSRGTIVESASNVQIRILPEDPNGVTRISAGGNRSIGYYLSIRSASLSDAASMLEFLAAAARKAA